jgi:hypothetical protein
MQARKRIDFKKVHDLTVIHTQIDPAAIPTIQSLPGTECDFGTLGCYRAIHCPIVRAFLVMLLGGIGVDSLVTCRVHKDFHDPDNRGLSGSSGNANGELPSAEIGLHQHRLAMRGKQMPHTLFQLFGIPHDRVSVDTHSGTTADRFYEQGIR